MSGEQKRFDYLALAGMLLGTLALIGGLADVLQFSIIAAAVGVVVTAVALFVYHPS